MRELLLLMEKNGKATAEELAAKLNRDVDLVKKQIAELEDNNTIVGYKALINWEKFDKDWVLALIDLKVTPQLGKGFDRIAEKIYQYPHVKSVYLVSGGYDLSLTIEGQNMKDVALFVAEKLAPMECIESTATHFILRKYKESGIIFNNCEHDGRQVITL